MNDYMKWYQLLLYRALPLFMCFYGYWFEQSTNLMLFGVFLWLAGSDLRPLQGPVGYVGQAGMDGPPGPMGPMGPPGQIVVNGRVVTGDELMEMIAHRTARLSEGLDEGEEDEER